MENYDIQYQIGSGAFGVIKRVINIETKEVLAMKCIRRGDIDAEYLEREIMNHRILQHPNIIQFTEVVLNKNMVGIVMELADGGELLGGVLTEAHYTEDKARGMFQQLIAGLAYIHSKQISHRDLKPTNILLNSKGVLKICDFGLSKIQSSAKTRVGTPGYQAPEVKKAKKTGSGASYEGRLADVWSCGVTLYKMLTNKRLVQGNLVHCINSLPVSDECKDLLCKMLLVNPAKRITVEKIKLHKWYTTNLPEDLKEDAQADICKKAYASPSCQTVEDIMKIIAEIKSDLLSETVDEAVEISVAAQDGIEDIADKKNGI